MKKEDMELIEKIKKTTSDTDLLGILLDVQKNEAERNLKRFFELSVDMVCIAGMDGYFKEVSSSFERTLGYSRKELLSRPYKDFVVEEDLGKTDGEVASLQDGSPTFHFENRYRCKDGSIRWFAWRSSAPTRDDLVYAIARDVTDQKEKEQLLRHYTAQLEVFKKEVNESLRYAHSLQSALLQEKEELKESLPESFIFYQPKNVVSGDFYWFKNAGDKVFASVGDCTGHGIPGALMTMMGLNTLHSLYNHMTIASPALLLKSLDLDIHAKLSHKSKGKVMNDSMDIAICEIDKKQMALTISGANSNVYLVRSGQIQQFKTDRYNIGNAEAGKEFGTKYVPLEKGDTIYMSSDGFIDQFGGEKGKKYSSRRFRALLVSMSKEEFQRQEMILPGTFNAWQGKEEQTDDVLVLGIKI